MIDEKKLTEDLIPLLNEYGDMYLAGRILGMIDSQPQADKWISCEERLPSEEEPCITKEFAEKCKEVAKKYQKPMTNADRIRNMSDEELAQFIKCARCDAMYGSTCEQQPYCEGMLGKTCNAVERIDKGLLQWLQAEVKEGVTDECN